MFDKKIPLFVYGTLMSGFRANKLIPKKAEKYNGYISGNLYYCMAGYPVADIVKSDLSYYGTKKYAADFSKQLSLSKNYVPKSLPRHCEYGIVYGELYKLPCKDASGVLSCIDLYESFSDDPDSCLYRRVLVPVQLEDGSYVWGWVYTMDYPPKNSIKIPSGSWRGCVALDGEMKPEYRFSVSERA